MATTAGTTTPMVPVYNPYGSTSSILVWHGTAEDTAIVKGDVLIYNTENLDEGNTTPAVSTVVGVALEAEDTAGGEIAYCPALPGTKFECNLVNTTNDVVGVAATHIGVKQGINQSADGYACFDIGTATDIALSMGWGRQTNTTQDAQEFGSEGSGIGVTNPRMIITFISSVFSA